MLHHFFVVLFSVSFYTRLHLPLFRFTPSETKKIAPNVQYSICVRRVERKHLRSFFMYFLWVIANEEEIFLKKSIMSPKQSFLFFVSSKKWMGNILASFCEVLLVSTALVSNPHPTHCNTRHSCWDGEHACQGGGGRTAPACVLSVSPTVLLPPHPHQLNRPAQRTTGSARIPWGWPGDR